MNPNYLIKNIMWCIIIAIFLAIVFMTSGCSTVAGMGTDIKGAADWTHDKMTKPSVDLNNK
jgi:predicted small secreted protein